MRRVVLIAVVLCASLSCKDSTGARLAATDFVSKADAICERSRAEIREVEPPEDESLDEIARVLEETLPIQRDALAALGELEPPDDAESDFEEYLRLQRDALRDLADAEQAALDEDREDYDRATRRAQSKYAEIQELAQAAGLQTCSGTS